MRIGKEAMVATIAAEFVSVTGSLSDQFVFKQGSSKVSDTHGHQRTT